VGRAGNRATRELPGEGEGALAGVRREAVDVDESGDLARIGRDVRDHGAAVGVGAEEDWPVDRPDDVADGLGIAREASQRVGGGDHVVAGALEGLDDLVPARGLGEGAVDENDRGGHGDVLSGGVR
jgi:hypothetical protein